MAEIKTFSSAVDKITRNTGRPEARTKERTERAVRTACRECSGLQIFFRDMRELSIIVPSNNYVWKYPIDLRILRTVKYPASRYEIEFPPLIQPGKRQRDELFYYYAGPGYYVFQGIMKGDELKLAYYQWPPHLRYYAENSRPAIYDEDEEDEDSIGEWKYLQSDGTYKTATDPDQELTEEQQEGAQEKVTNWLIFNWWDTIIEGGSTKVYNFLDDPRAPKSYSLYKSMQNTLSEGEPHDSLER